MSLIALLFAVWVYSWFAYWSDLDWDYQHKRNSAQLSEFEQGADDGLYKISLNEMEYRLWVTGMNNSGPAIIMLHGFPEAAIMWQPLMEAAAAQGYRVAAFDQRGYSPNARPKALSDYKLDILEKDVIQMADALGFEDFNLVGHDWGAVVSWAVAIHYPQRIKTLTTLSIPHLGLFFDAIETDEAQGKAAAYMPRLRMPFLPEFRFLKSKQAFIRGWFSKLPEEQEAEYLLRVREPGAFTAMLDWYRANIPADLIQDESVYTPVRMPTLFIIGDKDSIAQAHIVAKQDAYVDAPYSALHLDTGHNLIQRKTDEVVNAVMSHLGKYAQSHYAEIQSENRE
ncbi:MAG: alpha/beta hydrolase [Pseudomonadota bacterium]